LYITVLIDRLGNQPISPHSLLGAALEKCFKTRPADQPLPLFILQLLPIACFVASCPLPLFQRLERSKALERLEPLERVFSNCCLLPVLWTTNTFPTMPSTLSVGTKAARRTMGGERKRVIRNGKGR
jgi:hypothetical protein